MMTDKLYQPHILCRRRIRTLLVAPILIGAFSASAAATETRGPGHVDAALRALVPPVDEAAVCFVYRSKSPRPAPQGNRIRSLAFGVLVEHDIPDDKFVYGFNLRIRTAQDREAISAAGECGWAYKPGPPSLDSLIHCSAECDGGALTIKQGEAEGTLILDLGSFRAGRHLGCGSYGRTLTAREQPNQGFRLVRASLSQCWPDKHTDKKGKP